MRLMHLAFWLATLCVVSACGHPMQRKLEGRWLGEAVENFADAHFAAASGWAKGLSLEFAGSSVTVAIPAEEPRTGQYEVLHARDQEVQLAISDTKGKADRVHLKLDDERSLRWLLDDGRAIRLRRE